MVSTEDLRMTKPEAEQFARALGLDIHGDLLARLLHSTEGWVAGLYLAALQLQVADDPEAWLDEFDRGHRHVSDFLASEVLSGLAPDVRALLSRTSVLERFNGALASAVSGRPDAGRVVEELVRSNLFIIPLDSRRNWYRFHHLFAELLRCELAATAPEAIPGLHGAAAGWYVDHGFVDEAVQHALAARDVALASDVIARNWIRWALEGQGDTVIHWFDQIGDEALRADARLAMAKAMVMTHLGRLGEAEAWVTVAKSVPSPAPPLDGTASIESGAALVQAVCCHFQGAFTLAASSARAAMSLEPLSSPWRSVAALALGGSQYWLGDHVGADEALAESVRAGAEGRMHFPVILAKGYQAAIAFDRGRRNDAEQLAHEALEQAERVGAAMYGEPLMAHLVLARILRHDGDVKGGVRHADRAISLGRRAGWPSLLAAALLVRATLGLRRDRRPTAASFIADAEQLLPQEQDLGMLGALLSTVKQQVGTGRVTTGPEHAIIEPLTARELDVLRLLQTELTRNEIAQELSVSTNTVKTHTQAVYRKLGISDRRRVVERARTLGIV